MERYNEYKDSGTDWINKIPSDWELLKLKYLSRMQSGNSITGDKINDVDEYPVYGGNGFRGFTDDYTNDGEYILIGRQGALCGNVRIVNGKFWASEHAVVVYQKDNVNMHWYRYLLEAMNLNQYSTSAAQPGLSVEQIINKIAFLPKYNTQKEIASYLDRKIAKIDTLISDKEKLIELLKEKRQSIISEAVTKGLDPTVTMHDSGIRWIGQIPGHWNVKRIKFVFEIVKRLYYQEDRDVLSITQKGIRIRDRESNEGQLAQSYAGYQLVHINDFAMNSMDLLTGFVDCSPYEGVTSPDYRVFRFIPGRVQSHAYYKYIFQMLYTSKIFYGFGQGVSTLGRWRLQTDTFMNFWIPVPPLDEQEEIAEYVIKQSEKIDMMIDITQKQIDLLKEYRQSIISEAVTGKVKVKDGGIA